MYIAYTIWIAIRTLMTNSDKKITLFTLANNDKYKDITPNLLIGINIMITKNMH